MPRITGGEVSFGRTIKTGDFENARSDVKLSFSVDEGEDHNVVLNHVAALAKAKAQEMVGIGAPKTDKDKLTEVVLARAEAGGTDPVTTDRKKPGPKPKVDKPPTATKDPAAVEEEKPNISVSPEDRKDPAAVDDGLGDLLGDAPKPITDADLQAKVAQHNQKIKNPVAIRALVAKYAGQPPKRLTDIPADTRGIFLSELLKL